MTDTEVTADLKAEAARYHDAFLKANEAVTVREVAIARLTAERDLARDIAVALEGQVAASEGVEADRWDEGHAQGVIDALRVHGPAAAEQRLLWVLAVTPTDDNPYRAALDPDPADRGTGRP